MKNKLLLLLLLIFLSFGLVGCQDPIVEDVIVSIEIDSKTLPEKILKTEVSEFIDNLNIVVKYSDESTELIPFRKEMITEEDYMSLFSLGVHTVEVEFNGFKTEFSIEVYEQVYEYYTLKVVYPDGSPVNGDILVKLMKSIDDYKTTRLDENGQARVIYDNLTYHVRLFELPEGYTYNPNIYIFNENTRNLEIKLIELSVFVEGMGTKSDPIYLNYGTYEVSFDQVSIPGMKFFYFRASKTGKIVIESYSEEKIASNPVDPYFGFIGETLDMSNVDYSANENNYVNINFKYETTVEEGKYYYFLIFASTANSFPATFTFSITN